MEIIDCHTHVFMHPKKEDILKSLEDIWVIENGLDTKTNKIVIEESKKYDNVLCAVGLHPTNVLKYTKDALQGMIENLRSIIENGFNKIVAIGEIGLDYYWVKDNELRRLEIHLFNILLDLALTFNLPVIVHSRNSEKDIYGILSKYDGIVILHSFMGKLKIAKRFLEHENVYFSIPAIVYRLKELQRLVEIIPVEKILIETDTPFLSPIKGSRNEPKYVIYGIRKISEIKGISEDDLKKILLKNFREIFGRLV